MSLIAPWLAAQQQSGSYKSLQEIANQLKAEEMYVQHQVKVAHLNDERRKKKNPPEKKKASLGP